MLAPQTRTSSSSTAIVGLTQKEVLVTRAALTFVLQARHRSYRLPAISTRALRAAVSRIRQGQTVLRWNIVLIETVSTS